MFLRVVAHSGNDALGRARANRGIVPGSWRTVCEEAASQFDKSITILSEIKADSEPALAYAGYGRIPSLKGDFPKARGYLT